MEFHFEQKPPLSAMDQVVNSIGMDTEVQCRVCMQPLRGQLVVKVEKNSVHEACCRCVVCHVSLEEKCHEKGGRLYCDEHYFRDCSPYRCAGCKQGVAPCDMVYKLKAGMVFHVACHACCRCGRALSPGEQILVDETAMTVACMDHYGEQAPCSSSFPVYPSAAEIPSEPDFQIKKEIDTYGYGFDNYAFADYCDDDGKFLKRRGPRTTIKQNQLDVLNSIFSTTPKPSKHARAKLALETGLSMRVIQVWFQNRRSKERRLKHLCNYLRHYEQRGLIPPPINFSAEGNCGVAAFGGMVGGLEGAFEEEEDDDE